MKPSRFTLAALLILGSGPAFGQYERTDLGSLFGGRTAARGVNGSGRVVGESLVSQVSHAFSWTSGGGMTDLGRGWALAVNDSGVVAGTMANGALHAVIWNAGGMVDLDPLGLGSQAVGINSLGDVAGELGWHATVWKSNGTTLDLGTLGGINSIACAINDLGHAAGWSETGGAVLSDRAFFWSPESGMVDIGTLGGRNSQALGINIHGQVVGQAETASGDTHAFLWTPTGGMIDLGTLGEPSFYAVAEDINDDGSVVGTLFVPSSWSLRPFVWTASKGMRDLGGAGQNLLAAGISRSGLVEIVSGIGE